MLNFLQGSRSEKNKRNQLSCEYQDIKESREIEENSEFIKRPLKRLDKAGLGTE